MKVKEVEVTANVAWSPASQSPVYLAAGTAAQQLDATFNTSSALEIYALNLAECEKNMPKLISRTVDYRYHRLVWGKGRDGNTEGPNGIIVGGMDGGLITAYDAASLVHGHDDPILFSRNKHSGAVSSLDFCPFQINLLASGASESEIFIWDMNRPQAPMSPGAKSQPPDDVRCVAWNRQVQHILATNFSTRCVIWDLRKNDPIIEVSDHASRMRWKVVAWHPEVATQMCLASEDDRSPVVQIWDLRSASSPLRTIEHHRRGVLSLAWCERDSDLLLSCGKDNRLICWNPSVNLLDVDAAPQEIATSRQWTFDVQWCPKNPAVIAASSFDGRISIYSLMGGEQHGTQSMPEIADSFPGMQELPDGVRPPTSPHPIVQLKEPPKWMRRPCGANFGFGGKLVSFDTEEQRQNGVVRRSGVYLSTVVTDRDLLQRSMRLETSLKNGNFVEFCEAKIANSVSIDQQIWKFIRANYDENPRQEFLDLLGYDPQRIDVEIAQGLGVEPKKIVSSVNGFNGDDINVEPDEVFNEIAAKNNKEPISICTDNSGNGLLSKALITGNRAMAVELCLKQKKFPEALILASQGDPELWNHVQKSYFEDCRKEKAEESVLLEAVVNNEWHTVVERCDPVGNWREALTGCFTNMRDDPKRFSANSCHVGDRLMEKAAYQEAMVCFICSGDVDKVVECWLKTHGSSEEGLVAKTEFLQDLVEVVMLLKQSKAHPDLCDKGELMSSYLAAYASLLAAQGAFEAALTYLGDSEDPVIVALRQRLEGAIGRMSNKKTSQVQRVSVKTDGYNPVFRYPPHGADHYTSYTGIHNPAVEDLSNFSPTIPHQEPAAITQRRNSRPRNPSVESCQFQHTGSIVAPPSNDGYKPPYSNKVVVGGGGGPLPPLVEPPTVNIFTPDYSKQLAAPPPMSSSQGSVVPGGSYCTPPTSSGPGWNDPPPMALLSKPKSSNQADHGDGGAVMRPITQPLMMMTPSGGQNPSVPPIPPVYGGQPPVSTGPYNFNQLVPNPPTSSVNLLQPVQEGVSSSSFSQRNQQQTPVEKVPLPTEHRVLQEVFDSLRTRCLAAAFHPQVKKKLEDVGKKLQVLYDKLREGSLPTPTVSGLHQIVEFVWAYDYQSCLGVVNQLVSTGSFSILSQFLPGIKVLLQVASQMGVYLDRSSSPAIH